MICDDCNDSCVTMIADSCKCGEEKNALFELCEVCSEEEFKCESCGCDMREPESLELDTEL